MLKKKHPYAQVPCNETLCLALRNNQLKPVTFRWWGTGERSLSYLLPSVIICGNMGNLGKMLHSMNSHKVSLYICDGSCCLGEWWKQLITKALCSHGVSTGLCRRDLSYHYTSESPSLNVTPSYRCLNWLWSTFEKLIWKSEGWVLWVEFVTSPQLHYLNTLESQGKVRSSSSLWFIRPILSIYLSREWWFVPPQCSFPSSDYKRRLSN